MVEEEIDGFGKITVFQSFNFLRVQSGLMPIIAHQLCMVVFSQRSVKEFIGSDCRVLLVQ